MIQSLFLDRKSRQICGNFPTIVQSKNHHRLGHFNTKIAPKAHQKDNYNMSSLINTKSTLKKYSAISQTNI